MSDVNDIKDVDRDMDIDVDSTMESTRRINA
jgi:hypothetical protein